MSQECFKFNITQEYDEKKDFGIEIELQKI